MLNYSLNETVDENISKHIGTKNEKENSSEFKKREYFNYYLRCNTEKNNQIKKKALCNIEGTSEVQVRYLLQ